MRTAKAEMCAACGLDAPYYDADGLCPLCSPEWGNGHTPKDAQPYQNRPVETPTTNALNDSPSELQSKAQEVIAYYGGIRPAATALSEKLGERINHGVLGLALRGEDFPKARRVLGMPPKGVIVQPCPDCGKVHKQEKQCKPRRKSGKVRFSFWLTEDERDHMREITDSHPGGRAAWLMEKVER